MNLALAVACFNLAYASTRLPVMALFIVGYAGFLVQLTNQPTVRRAFYFGLAAGFGCAAGQAFFFSKIFGVAAVVLWIVFGFWIGLFTAISCGCIRRWGKPAGAWLVPIIWTGTEYFRSELYYLRFSWLNIGYAFSNVPHTPFNELGMYGVGFVVVFVMSAICFLPFGRNLWVAGLCIGLAALTIFAQRLLLPTRGKVDSSLTIAGVQMEVPPEKVIPEILNQALAKNPKAGIFVMSEYTLEEGGIPDALKDWCRKHSRFLVFGGKDVVTNDVYYDTAFVIGTNGDIVFKQAKCVPVQFMKDGLPATRQEIWDSPWGKIGICICYDLSYTRVTDALVRDGAQMLIVPSMDVEEWGRHEHELHFRVAPVRAAENGIPIFRVASSGISQAVSSRGTIIARTSIPGRGDILSAQMQLPAYGSIPIDRVIAPFCVIVTGAITAMLLFLNWQGGRPNQKGVVSHMSHKMV
ncbi:MAG TPA: nitrilase-related carbon-nitrogen hydrolase [Candidatus Sulfotelmatobacter sp.]|nr:nitrilase-related carbon-nitrogen hydrolase [Candidatus Sulfotelmatobacter sp.]